jgi:hypothetical protein
MRGVEDMENMKEVGNMNGAEDMKNDVRKRNGRRVYCPA